MFIFFLFILCISFFSLKDVQAQPKIFVYPITTLSKADISSDVNRLQTKLYEVIGKQGILIRDKKVEGLIKKIGSKAMTKTFMYKLAKDMGVSAIIYGNLIKLGKEVSIELKIARKSSGFIPEPISLRTTFPWDEEKVANKIGEMVAAHLFPSEKIEKVLVKGNKRIESDAILSHVKSAPGLSLDKKRISDDIRSIYKMGYFEQVQADVSPGKKGKVITFIVKERPVIRKVIIRGNKKVDKDDIEPLITSEVGGILNKKFIKDDITKIKSIYREKGYYRATVKAETRPVGTGQVDLIYHIKEGKKTYIKKIRFVGNRKIRSKDLKKVMETKERGLFSWITSSGVLVKEVLDKDLEAIASYYYSRGFIHARVGKPEIDYKEDGLYITIPVEEGPRYKVGSVSLEGDILGKRGDLLKLLKIKKEKYFNRDTLRKDIMELRRYYADKGYAHVKVRPLIKEDSVSKAVNLTFNIKKGPLVTIDRIKIVGNTKTRDKVIRRELKIYEQEKYSLTGLRKSNMRLHRLNYFEEIEIEPKPKGEDKMDIEIRVKEKQTGALTLGGGYSSVDGFLVMGQLSEANLFGKGQKLSFQGRFGGKSSQYNIKFIEPWLFDRPIYSAINLYDWRREYDDYTKDALGASLTFGRPLFEYVKGYITYKYEEANITDVDDTASNWIKEWEGWHLTSSIEMRLKRDTRSRFFNPDRGSNNYISVEYAGGPLGGTNAFTKYIANSSWYIPLFWHFVGHVRGRIGYVEENPDGDLPIYEKFFLGGINTVRGFKYHRISPIDPETGDRIGGEKMLLFNVELRIPLVREAGIYGVLFYDMGNVYTKDESYDLGDLRKGAGFGIRWFSPIGPLRFEWGWNLDPRPGEDDSTFEFTVGTFF